ncbi:MAG: FAD-dependent oxidoreductase [Pseudobacteriovorax sp.]|nr:FAD-dependent oxidoreductase [Pseudobacteriovorax sp.]
MKKAGAGATVAATAGAGSTAHASFGRDYEIVNQRASRSGRKFVEEDKSVLVVGGGVAGLTAAYELSKRGYQVHIREAAPYLGGRLHTREETLKTGTFQVEHGLHMWFKQYYNFERILKELGVWQSFFRPFEEVYFQFDSYKDEVIRSKGPYPLNLARIVLESPNLNLLDAAQTFGGIVDAVFYNHDTVYKRFDKESFADFAKRTNINRDFYNVVMEPAASVTLNDIEKISAAEMLMYMHLFFIGDPDAFNRKVATVDHGTAVINPMANAIRMEGGEISLSSPVSTMEITASGSVVTLDDQREYDYLVLASDIPGLRKILPNMRVQGERLQDSLNSAVSHLSQLKLAPPYHVLRVWLDKSVDSNRPFYESVIETPESKPMNLICDFAALEMESQAWCEENEGAILELHLYNTPEFIELSKEDIWEQTKDLAFKAYPEVAGANLLDASLGRFDNFTSVETGQGLIRPKSDFMFRQGFEKIFLAGDWTHTDYPTALMERAAASGIEAANGILVQDRVRQQEIRSASKRGPGLLPRW